MSCSTQAQSRFFQLPRELRDRIYFFCFYEPKGLHHHLKGDNGVLRTFEGNPVDVQFTRTCKAAANEANGLALKINIITFTPADRTGEQPLGSDALRLKRLHDAIDATKWRLVDDNDHCLSPTHVNQLLEVYPRAGRDIMMTLHALREGRHHYIKHWHAREQKDDKEIEAALDLALEFAETHPGFDSKTRNKDKPFISRSDTIWSDQKWFQADLPYTILQWRSNSSIIPTESELRELEAHLDSTATYRFHTGNEVTAFAWFFSAASLAASFLKGLHPTQRLYLRSIILEENEKAVDNPERHARELIRFCQENTKMRIERGVGLWDHIFPSRWGADEMKFWWTESRFSTIIILEPIIEWITEAENLPALGMPSGSYNLTFSDCNDKHVWRMVRKMFDFQEAFHRDFQQRKNFTVPALPLEDEPYRYWRFPYPCHIPEKLPKTMKAILLGNGNIKLEHSLPTKSDMTRILHACENWSLNDWLAKWHDLMFRDVHTFSGGISTQYSGYSENIFAAFFWACSESEGDEDEFFEGWSESELEEDNDDIDDDESKN